MSFANLRNQFLSTICFVVVLGVSAMVSALCTLRFCQ